MPSVLSKPTPETSSEAASRYRGASVWMIVQGWCPNHKSGGTERIAMSGITARSAQPTEDDSVSGNQNPEAVLLAGRRPASSLNREPNARLSLPRRFAHFGIILQPSRGSFQLGGRP